MKRLKKERREVEEKEEKEIENDKSNVHDNDDNDDNNDNNNDNDDEEEEEEEEVEMERNIKRKDILRIEEDEFVNNDYQDDYEGHDNEEQMIMHKKCKHNNNEYNRLNHEHKKSKSCRYKYNHGYNNDDDDDVVVVEDEGDEHDEIISLAEEQPPCEYHDDDNGTEDDNPKDDEHNEEDCLEDNNVNSSSSRRNNKKEDDFYSPPSQQQSSHQAYQYNHYYYQPQQMMIPTSLLTPPTISSSTYPFYGSNNSNTAPFPYFPPQQPQPPMPNSVFYPPSQPPTLSPSPQFQPYQFPTHLPMPLSPLFPQMTLNEHSPNNINTADNNNNNNNMNGQPSSLFQEVQYYESKMRDHAAAYATAAAGAAWAAAQIATAAGNTTNISTTHNNHHHHHPQRHNHNIFKSDNGIKKQKRSNHGNMMNNRNMNSNNSNSSHQRNKNVMHNQKQCHHQQNHHQSMNHYQQNKRSRYNNNNYQNQSGNYQQSNHHNYFKKKRTLGLETLYGKNGVSALFELCSKQNWSPPKFMLVSTGNANSQVVNNSNHSDNSRKEAHNNAGAESGENVGNDVGNENADVLGAAGADDSTSNQVTLSDSNNDQVHHILSEDRSTKTDSKQSSYKGVSNTSVVGLSSCLDFVISVSINGEEFGRGRGGSKKSAQQDAARKTLELLYPGIIFDTNGILIDLGSGIDDIEISGEEDLNLTNLASRLAIDGEAKGKDSGLTVEGKRSRRGSPTPSEDSSISTTVSMSKNIVMTGGPFKQPGASGRIRSIYPCASSVSSATSEDDDDEYFASRGAHICSVLLHAMAQIDERIREPPSYTFDVCATTMASQHQQEGKSSTKRKGGVGDAIASKRRSATTDVGRVVTIHRCSFACTASLILYHKIEKIQHNIDNDNNAHRSTSQTNEQEEKSNENSDEIKGNEKQVLSETNKGNTSKQVHSNGPNKKTDSMTSPSKCDSLIKEEEKESQEIVLEKEDSDGSNSSRSESNSEGCIALSKQTDQDKSRAEKVKSTPAKQDSQEEEIKTEKLEAMATGASKRDAKHIASAKLLALLFPECKGMVEVVKSAEAARERYAENKALKQSMKATNFAYTKRKKIKCEEKNDLDSESEILQLEQNVNESTKPLQSVKEEDSEDNEELESEDQLCHKRLKLK